MIQTEQTNQFKFGEKNCQTIGGPQKKRPTFQTFHGHCASPSFQWITGVPPEAFQAWKLKQQQIFFPKNNWVFHPVFFKGKQKLTNTNYCRCFIQSIPKKVGFLPRKKKNLSHWRASWSRGRFAHPGPSSLRALDKNGRPKEVSKRWKTTLKV